MLEDNDAPQGSETAGDVNKDGPRPRGPTAKRRPTRKRRRKKQETSDFRIVLESVLAEVVEAHEGGKVRKISRQQAYLNGDLRNALKGDAKATLRLVKKAEKYGLLTKPTHRSGSFLIPPKGDDGKILRMFDAEQEAIKLAEEKGDVGMPGIAGLTLSKRK